jgi:hypothetical protein
LLPPCLDPRARARVRAQLKPNRGFSAIAPASRRAFGLTSVRTQEERRGRTLYGNEPARLSCRTMKAGQGGPATRDRAIQGGWSLIAPADSANILARMGTTPQARTQRCAEGGSYPRKWKRWVYRHRLAIATQEDIITACLCPAYPANARCIHVACACHQRRRQPV